MKKRAAALCFAGALALGVSAVPASDGTREIPVSFRNIKVFLDGKQLVSGEEPLIYNGTAYLPIRSIGVAVGKEVEWDAATNTVALQEPLPIVEESAPGAESRTDFTLSVTPSGGMERAKILRIRESRDLGMTYNLYYYGLSDVSVTLDGQTLPLAEALENGTLSPADILAKARQDQEAGLATRDAYRDGGSVEYTYGEYSIVKFYSLDGNRNLYISIPKIDLQLLEEQYYNPQYESLHEVILDYANMMLPVPGYTQSQERKQHIFERGVDMIEVVALRDNLTEEELQEAIQQFRGKCELYGLE